MRNLFRWLETGRFLDGKWKIFFTYSWWASPIRNAEKILSMTILSFISQLLIFLSFGQQSVSSNSCQFFFLFQVFTKRLDFGRNIESLMLTTSYKKLVKRNKCVFLFIIKRTAMILRISFSFKLFLTRSKQR